jgi:hypothetical protein
LAVCFCLGIASWQKAVVEQNGSLHDSQKREREREREREEGSEGES